VAGAGWCVGAVVLLVRACFFLRTALTEEHRTTVAVGVTLLVAAVVGLAKATFVLKRTARKSLRRIQGLPEPLRPWHAFPPSYLIVLPAMVGLGLAVRHAASHGWAGGWLGALGIYVAVGIALAWSSADYFRA
jgi:hypothetical protein